MPEMRSLGVADDIRAAWRSLRRRTAVTATAVLLLAVGIAVAATTFAVVHAIALRPLAQAGADRLVTPVTTDPSRNVTAGLVSYPQFLEWSATPGLFERLSLPAPRRSGIRERQRADAALDNIRHRIAALDPRLAVLDAGPISRVAGDHTADSRTARVALVFFAAFGWVLACAGIYAITSRAVAGRRREFGIRMALGARPYQVARLVTLQMLGPAAVGIAAGLAAAFSLVRVLRSLLFEIRPADPVTFVAVPIVFALVAFAASAIPARHAARFDPATTLRGE